MNPAPRRLASALAGFLFGMIAAAPAIAASFEKAERYMDREDWKNAREQYSALIRKSGGTRRQEAYLGLARTYFYEKDFRGVIRAIDPLGDRIPENKNGAWMRLMVFRSAIEVGDTEAAARHYQALLRIRTELSIRDLADHLALLKKLGLLKKPPAAPADAGSDDFRRASYLLAESLMTGEISRGAARIWTMLVVGKPDQISRLALLRLGQAHDGEGEWAEADRYLKLSVLFFPEDPRSADALYRLAKWSRALGSSDASAAYSLAAEYYPSTLYGALSAIDMAWSWPSQEAVRSAVRAVRDAPGLPDAVLERGLSLALVYPDWISDPADLEWAVRRYLLSFPLGPNAAKASEILESAKKLR